MKNILTKEEFESFIKFAFKRFNNRNIKKLFINPNLQIKSWPKSKVRVRPGDVFVDFPREVSNIIEEICRICNEKSADLPENARNNEGSIRYKKFVESIKSEKNNSEEKLGKLSQYLKSVGIKWNIVFAPHYKKSVIKYEVEGYYRYLWKNKVLQFIEELQKGDDSLVSIYEKVQVITIKHIRPTGIRIPHIIDFILEENDYLSIEKELKKLERLFGKIKKYAKKNPAYFFEPLLMDIKTIIYQIRYTLRSGYCFTSFLLLRKLIVDLGCFFFLASYPQRERKDKEYLEKSWKWLEKWIHSFKRHDEWPKPLFYSSKEGKKIIIPDMETFRNTIRNKGNDFYSNATLDLRDKFLVEQLDIIRNYKMNIWSFSESDMKIPDEIYKEYRDLCEIVHEPIYIDYSPFGSFLEYLAFLYHIRKVLYFLDDLLTIMKKTYSKVY